MANWCDNMVVFKGCPSKVQQVLEVFKEMIYLSDITGYGQYPSVAEELEGAFFELKMVGNAYAYRTMWLPNVDMVKAVADHFGLDFIHRYWETGCHIFGIDIYKDGVLSSTPLMSPFLLDEDGFKEQEADVDRICTDAFGE